MINITINIVHLVPRLLVSLLLAGWMGHASAAPITDIVDVDGREWAQIDLFDFTAVTGISELCPAGVCAGTLAAGDIEYDLTGWTWATTLTVAELFNYYIGADELNTAGVYSAENSASINNMISDGWRVGTAGTDSYVDGWTSDAPAGLYGSPVASLSQLYTGYTGATQPWPTIQSFNLLDDNRRDTSSGLWLYRDSVTIEPVTIDPVPAASVPTAGSLALFGLGLLLLLARRNRRQQ